MESKPSIRRKPIFYIGVGVAASLCLVSLCCVIILAMPSDKNPESQSTDDSRLAGTISLEEQVLLEPTQTPTKAPSNTATATVTPLPSDTPTSTPTSTSLPPELATGTAIAATRTQFVLNQWATSTQQAANSTATRDSRNATATQQALNITATREALQATATQKSANATSTVVAEDTNYRLTIIPYLKDYSEAMDKFSDLNYQAGENPYLILDKSWKLDVAITLAAMQTAGDKLGSVKPVPVAMRTVNFWLVKIMQETHTMIANYSKGIDELSEYYINLANQNIQNITKYSNNAMEELDKLNNTP